jgi:DNA-binding NtrC family response regulator
VTFADLPRRVALLTSAAKHPTPVQEAPMQLDRFLSEVERELLERALRRARGNKARAARLLGIPRARLLRRIAQLGLATNE